jgi:hypothetical protein
VFSRHYFAELLFFDASNRQSLGQITPAQAKDLRILALTWNMGQRDIPAFRDMEKIIPNL